MVVIITGSTRGIGKEAALRLGREGHSIVVCGKTVKSHPKLPGTITETAEEVNAVGGKAIAIELDVRSEESVTSLVEKTIQTFGQIDCLINNAGAIYLSNLENTPPKRFDLMMGVNTRGVYLCSHAVIPHLKNSGNPHIINLSPPLNLKGDWMKKFLPYSLSKFGMTILGIGLAEELKQFGIAVNCLWPKTLIATAAVEFNIGNPEMLKACRKPEIVAEAIATIVKQPAKSFSGRCLLDEEVLRDEAGITDFTKYNVNPDAQTRLIPDLFL